MARNTEKRRQLIFEDALVAAKKIARKEGLASLTVRRIARDIGCSVGTIYNVFDNLDTLILHLNGRTFDALYEELIKVEAKGEPRAVVENLTETYLGFVRDNANLWNVIFEHVWPAKYPLPDWYREKVERLLKLLADILAPLFPPGREDENYLAALVLWSGLHGINSLVATGKLGIATSETARALSDLLVKIFFGGLIYRRQNPDAD
ncbi:MAG: TetR/AcrR family transcriptional regulator [Alphaproteobacteria bacterium]